MVCTLQGLVSACLLAQGGASRMCIWICCCHTHACSRVEQLAACRCVLIVCRLVSQSACLGVCLLLLNALNTACHQPVQHVSAGICTLLFTLFN
jgi:hypothetical protein